MANKHQQTNEPGSSNVKINQQAVEENKIIREGFLGGTVVENLPIQGIRV